MTYSPGSPGYPPAQPGGSYPGATPSFAKTEDTESKLPNYLNAAVVILGLAVYLLNFGPMFATSPDLNAPAIFAHDGGFGVDAAVLAAIVAGLGLLPNANKRVVLVAALALLGALMIISKTVNMPGGYVIGWAVWPLLAASVLQAAAAGAAVLLDAGVITAPTPRPKYDPYAQYGQYGQYGAQQPGYYGQPSAQQHTGPQHSQQQPAGYGSQYGGYPSSQSQSPTQAAIPTPSSGGFNAHSADQHGPDTPPTGFPSFSPPPPVDAGARPAGGSGPVNYSNPTGGQPSADQGQQPSSPSGPAPA